MAKPRDKTQTVELSSAFHKKVEQELERLRGAVSQNLREEMISLLEDTIHSDLLITNGVTMVRAHKCIVKARYKHLWQESWLTHRQDPDSDSDISCLEVPGLSRGKLTQFVRQLYSVSDSILLLEEYIDYMPGATSTVPPGPATSTVPPGTATSTVLPGPATSTVPLGPAFEGTSTVLLGPAVENSSIASLGPTVEGTNTVLLGPTVGDSLPVLPAVGDSLSVLPAVGGTLPVLPAVGDSLPVLPPVGDCLPVLPPVGDCLPVLSPVGDCLPVLPPVGDCLPVLSPVGDCLPVLPPVGDSLPVLPPVGDCLPVLLAVGDSLPVLPPVGDCLPVLPPGGDCLPVLPAVGDSLPVLPPVGDCLPVLPPVGDCLPVLPPVGDCLPVLPAVGDSLPVLPPVGDCLPVLPPVGDWSLSGHITPKAKGSSNCICLECVPMTEDITSGQGQTMVNDSSPCKSEDLGPCAAGLELGDAKNIIDNVRAQTFVEGDSTAMSERGLQKNDHVSKMVNSAEVACFMSGQHRPSLAGVIPEAEIELRPRNSQAHDSSLCLSSTHHGPTDNSNNNNNSNNNSMVQAVSQEKITVTGPSAKSHEASANTRNEKITVTGPSAKSHEASANTRNEKITVTGPSAKSHEASANTRNEKITVTGPSAKSHEASANTRNETITVTGTSAKSHEASANTRNETITVTGTSAKSHEASANTRNETITVTGSKPLDESTGLAGQRSNGEDLVASCTDPFVEDDGQGKHYIQDKDTRFGYPNTAQSAPYIDISVDDPKSLESAPYIDISVDDPKSLESAPYIDISVDDPKSLESAPYIDISVDDPKSLESTPYIDISVGDPKSLELTPYKPCSPLGRDLLNMYLTKLCCDCCLSVNGVHFLAHKCVLSARSEYFLAMFGGQWSESNMATVNLEAVSPQAVKQLLLFLYGGVTDLCAATDMKELFVVADMYGVLTFRMVLMFYIKKDLCHFFHKPCPGCMVGTSEALVLCHTFSLEELQVRCLKWMARYFPKIWPTKSFSMLEDSLHQLCFESILAQMTASNVLDTITECTKLISSLPRIKWTENVLYLVTRLMDSAIEFTSSHFVDVLKTQEFLQWSKVASWKASSLEDIFHSVIDSLPVDTACLVFMTLMKLQDLHSNPDNPEPEIAGLLEAMTKHCEKFFKTHIHHVTRSRQWAGLPQPVQARILEVSAYVYLTEPGACLTLRQNFSSGDKIRSHKSERAGTLSTATTGRIPAPTRAGRTKKTSPTSGKNTGKLRPDATLAKSLPGYLWSGSRRGEVPTKGAETSMRDSSKDRLRTWSCSQDGLAKGDNVISASSASPELAAARGGEHSSQLGPQSNSSVETVSLKVTTHQRVVESPRGSPRSDPSWRPSFTGQVKSACDTETLPVGQKTHLGSVEARPKKDKLSPTKHGASKLPTLIRAPRATARQQSAPSVEDEDCQEMQPRNIQLKRPASVDSARSLLSQLTRSNTTTGRTSVYVQDCKDVGDISPEVLLKMIADAGCGQVNVDLGNRETSSSGNPSVATEHLVRDNICRLTSVDECGNSVPICGSSVNKSERSKVMPMEDGDVSADLTEVKPEVRIVHMSKTLNVGFIVPPD